MGKFEYNWATAEMVKLYLRNSRAQEKRKAREAAEVAATTQDVPVINPGLATASGSGGENRIDDSDSSDSEDDESN
jgi:hypothetical protein